MCSQRTRSADMGFSGGGAFSLGGASNASVTSSASAGFFLLMNAAFRLMNAAFRIRRTQADTLARHGRHDRLLSLENIAQPADFHDCPVLRPLAVVQRDGGAGALQQGLGDKEAKAQAGGFAILYLTARAHRAGGDVRLTQGIHD